ncbi:MAG: type II toxin-antitoxin system RelE/ParE family toxin [Burkholderiaceae bacterium]
MKPSVSEVAEAELIDAARTYVEGAGQELGLAFIAEFERCIDLLCERPSLGMKWEDSIRRFPLRRFPYSIIYRIEDEHLRVLALAHQRRRPEYWQARK